MAARAMWKGVIHFGDIKVAVKLYSAIEDRNVHFRMLHRKDKQPVRQAMVNPETEEVVEYRDALRAWVSEEGDLVVLPREELDALEPEKSRNIEVIKFLPAGSIDHRWYERPYYLGPDGASEKYFALADALERGNKEALVQWAMRNKAYIGALKLHEGYPLLMSLRHAEEVIPVDALEAPSGKPLDDRELGMARQLIGMLAADFEPEEYHDEYRARVQELIENKAQGGSVKVVPIRAPKASDDLARALEASLRQAGNA